MRYRFINQYHIYSNQRSACCRFDQAGRIIDRRATQNNIFYYIHHNLDVDPHQNIVQNEETIFIIYILYQIRENLHCELS